MESLYEAEDARPLPLIYQLKTKLHIMLCPSCARNLRNLKRVEDIMRTDFLPLSPGFEDALMEQLYKENCAIGEKTDAPAGFSFRSWIIIGFFLILSLSSSFFGMNFIEIANSAGLSFLLPVGLTIGMVVTCYGALFIGSHLNELSTRFRLH